MSTGRAPGTLSILLHTHMPYVEGYGTWPFGEEWLWEALATSYLPLLALLDDGAPVTLSLTPVLADQLALPELGERCGQFIAGIRERTLRLDREGFEAAGEEPLAAQLARSWNEYEWAAAELERRGDLLAAFAAHADWTSSASHAVLPLITVDELTALQIVTGIDSHRWRFGGWGGGFWLPECAHAPWLEPLLAAAGVGATCVELTALLGAGAAANLRPLRSPHGPLLVPLDRQLIDLVWAPDGYPAAGAYRDRHRLTFHHHHAWRNDGAPYDPAAAAALARADATDFVARAAARLREAGGGVLVCALDTELLGHWWHEGIAWLAAVVEECAAQGVSLVKLDEALDGVAGETPPATPWHPSSWGAHNDLSTWSTGAASEIAFAIRAAELATIAAGAQPSALRELLALQASDWAFAVSRDVAAPYGRERHAGHLRELRRALAGEPVAGPRALAPALA